MRVAEAAELFAYDDWANERTFAALEELRDDEWAAEVGGSFGSVRATAAHLVGAELLWLARWRGRSPTGVPGWLAAPSLSRLRTELEGVAGVRRAWLAGLEDADLSAAIEYTLLSGARRSTELALLFRHLVNHSTYHRGQLAAFLRNLGHAPPPTDWVLRDYELKGV